jgi:excisionase family DNA binding protein
MTNEKLFYSPRELIDVIGLSSSTIARRLKDGTIPHSHLGNRVLVPSEWVDALAAQASRKA